MNPSSLIPTIGGNRGGLHLPPMHQYMLPSQEKIDRVGNRTVAYINVMLGSILDIADSLMLDSIAEMKAEGLFRQKAKREANIAKAEYDRIKAVLAKNTEGQTQLYLDTLDCIQDSIKGDIAKFYYPIKQVLDRHNAPQAAVKAHAEVVWSILHLATDCYKALCKSTQELLGVTLAPFFRAADPSAVLYHWEKSVECFCRYSKEVKDEFYADNNIKLATDIITKKLTSTDELEKCIKQAMRLNQDFMEEYFQRHPEQRVEL